jgi:AcrR family transcriptional regulator
MPFVQILSTCPIFDILTDFVNVRIQMLNRQKTIIASAAQVFTRYGVKRATMNDIASEAGVARQTLYNAFANKDAILRGIIDDHIEETCASISEHVTGNGTLEDGLELAFDHFARKPFEILRNTPHGGEIMEALEDAAGDEMIESKKRFRHAVSQMLSAHITKTTQSELSASSLADFIVLSAMGHKAKATDRDHLEDLLATLKAVIIKTTS